MKEAGIIGSLFGMDPLRVLDASPDDWRIRRAAAEAALIWRSEG